jgi:HSP20 family protein
MAFFRWGQQNDMFSELSRMQHDMDRLFSAFLPWQGGTRPSMFRAQVYPALNIYNDGESFILRAEVPGVDPKSLDIEVTGDTLTLRGERKLPELPEGASYHRRERDFGQFRRSFTLPEKVNSSKVVAKCEDGILEVRLPHAEEAQARKIAVKSK